MPYTSHGHAYGWIHADQPRPSVARCGGPRLCKTCSQEAAETAEVPELRGLPREVRALVHAADRMRDGWAEGDDARRAELWHDLHEACDAVWARNDKPARSEG